MMPSTYMPGQIGDFVITTYAASSAGFECVRYR